MDLRQLRYFVAVAEERSISRAARRLHIAQPPLSAQLRGLERDLGATLLTRHRRGVDLTAAGEELVLHARRLLGDVDAATLAVRSVGEGATGALALTFAPDLASTLIPELLRRYRDDRPDVILDLAEADGDEAAQRLRTRRADVVLLYRPPTGADQEFEEAVVGRTPVLAFLPVDHPLAAEDRLDLARLAEHSLLVPGAGPAGIGGALADSARQACELARVRPAELRGVTLVQTTIGLVAAGLGIALLPADLPALPGVTTRPLRQHVPPVEAAARWRRTEPPSPVLRQFLRTALATPEPNVLGPT